MNNLQIFKNNEFGEIRTAQIDNKIYFVGSDVARALGYKKPTNAVNQHCKGALKQGIHTKGGIQMMNCISEGDLYRLIVNSELPSAEKFEEWVFDEVLPSIRKNGGYIANQENLSTEQILANAVMVAQNVIANKDKLIQELKPKAEFFDAVASSKGAVEIGAVAKVLEIKGLGRNKLFELLRNERILMKNNQPYQQFVDRGYFRVLEQKYVKPDGETVISLKTLVYQRGVDYIRKLALRNS